MNKSFLCNNLYLCSPETTILLEKSEELKLKSKQNRKKRQYSHENCRI